MVGYLQPLAHNFAIVNELGYPTEYFIRWAQQKQIDIEESVGEARALEIVTTFLKEHPLQAGNGIDLAPDGDLNNSPTISAKAQEILDQITTTQGSILFRGGSGWEALPPGTSTQYLKSGGPASNPLWDTPSGGGGSAKIYGGLSPGDPVVSGSANATKGCCIIPLKDFSVTELLWQFDTVAGATYVGRVLQMNSIGSTVVAVLGTTSSVTTSSSTASVTVLFEFVVPIPLSANTTYALVLSRTDSADTYVLPAYGATATSSIMIGFPAIQATAFVLPKTTPIVGDNNNIAMTNAPFNLRLGGFNT